MNEKPLSDYIQYRREKAFETLSDISKMLDNYLLSPSMNRIYYAGFYIVSALLLLNGFSHQNTGNLLDSLIANILKQE